ncbi:ATP-dependent protease La (EC Type I [Olavius algarvensis associated proteobacterium Delta 3]|nr:ATP-dependent protease La (EC Type I [Olavius algarvensis associated proteobacterium Delta 3]
MSETERHDESIETEASGVKDYKIPEELPILPLRNTVAFPFTVLPLAVGIERSVKLVQDSVQGDRLIGLVAMNNPKIKEPKPGQTFEVGTLARVEHMMRGPDNSLQVLVHGLERFRIEYWTGDEPYLKARVKPAPVQIESDLELDALQRSLRDIAKEVVTLSPNFSQEAGEFLNQVDSSRQLVNIVATNAGLDLKSAQEVLEEDSLKEKMRKLIAHLTHEKEVLSLGQKIQSEAKEEMSKAQRDYFLRQQLKAINKELGETDEDTTEVEAYELKLEDAGLPEEAMKEARRELKRLSGMSPQAAEYTVIKSYLDWLVDLPWNHRSEDRTEIEGARKVLDDDHYGLDEVKERIIEYLAVRTLVQERMVETEKDTDEPTERTGAILCFAGPPGVGKTSLGQSIARALGRKFTRMSLGGMRDEAEIRGHRRTYIGAMPGRIIQAIKRARTRNPVFMLDEVDKIGMDWRGDPSSALLEVLDPAQNHAFRDHYLDVDFDLSDVMFITTANQLETIPPALRDRMEIIPLDGYTEFEKVQIASRHLVARQRKAHGLKEGEVTFSEDALQKIVQDYTREAGVRNLERLIGKVCRKSVVKIAEKDWSHVMVTPDLVREHLKKEKFEFEQSENIEIPGIATGLAVTSTGGDILFVEATGMKGKGKLTLTGQLGDVMRESAQIAHSYVRSKSEDLGVAADRFEVDDLHLHVPAGAIPKDGPSAGLAMVMAVASLFSDRPLRGDLGMTGEATLRGRVLPVGGIKMKVLAAHRAGLTTVILPKRNEKDLADVPDEVRNAMIFVLVDRIEEAFPVAFADASKDAEPVEAYAVS